MDKFIKILLILSCIFLSICEYSCQDQELSAGKPAADLLKSNLNETVELQTSKLTKKLLKPYVDEAFKRARLTKKDVDEATAIIIRYYTYLENKGIPYGKAAKDVVKNEGPFGKYANVHLRLRMEMELRHVRETGRFLNVNIEDLIDMYYKIRIQLAFADAASRAAAKDEVISYRSIADYHYMVLRSHNLSDHVWAGTMFEEFAGSGSWMNFGGYDTSVDFKILQLANAAFCQKLGKGRNKPLQLIKLYLFVSNKTSTLVTKEVNSEVQKKLQIKFEPSKCQLDPRKFEITVEDRKYESDSPAFNQIFVGDDLNIALRNRRVYDLFKDMCEALYLISNYKYDKPTFFRMGYITQFTFMEI